MRPWAKSTIALVTSGAVVAGGYFAWTAWNTPPGATHGVLQCVDEIDAGPLAAQSTATIDVSLSNTGKGPLTVTGWTSDCSCISIRVLPSNDPVSSSTRVSVAPGETLRLRVPYRVVGLSGIPATRTIRFTTDDPDRPAATIRVRYTPVEDLFTDPASVALGSIRASVPTRAEVQLFTRDRDSVAADIRVASSSPEQVRVTFAPDPPDAAPVRAGGADDSRRLGVVTVEARNTRAGELVNAEITIHTHGRPEYALKVPVTGRVERDFILAPESLFLPRMSSGGPVYSGVILCRGTGPEPLAVVATGVRGLTVSVDEVASNPSAKRVTITCSPGALGTGEVVVPLAAKQGGREEQLRLRVVIGETP